MCLFVLAWDRECAKTGHILHILWKPTAELDEVGVHLKDILGPR